MSITCHSMEEFLDCIEGLVKRGLTFKSDATALSIILLGGF